MDRKVRFAHFGVGKMGSLMVRYALDKGAELVAAFGSSEKTIGKDVGLLIGTNPIGLPVLPSSQAPEVLRSTKPDICMISTKGTLEEMCATITACAEAGCNCITIGEEAAWPWTTNPALTKKLDALAKEHGITISASGYPDTYWQTLPLVLAGATQKLQKICGTVTYNVEQYGPHFITGHGVGLSASEFEQHFSQEDAPAGYGAACMPGDPNGWLCHALGLTVVSQTMKNVPRYSDEAVWCESFGRDILPGQVLGTANVVHTETAEGIEIDMEVCGKIYAPGEQDALTWTLTGTPDTVVTVTAPNTPVVTALSPVNRIPDVLNAPPGYITADRFPPCRYLLKSMEYYVDK